MVTQQIQDSEAVSKRFRQHDPSWQAFCARVMVREARQVREHTSSQSLSNKTSRFATQLLMIDGEQQELQEAVRPLLFGVRIKLTSEANQTLNSEDFKPRGKCVCLLVKLSAHDALPKQSMQSNHCAFLPPAHSHSSDQRKGLQLQPYAGRSGTRERER